LKNHRAAMAGLCLQEVSKMDVFGETKRERRADKASSQEFKQPTPKSHAGASLRRSWSRARLLIVRGVLSSKVREILG